MHIVENSGMLRERMSGLASRCSALAWQCRQYTMAAVRSFRARNARVTLISVNRQRLNVPQMQCAIRHRSSAAPFRFSRGEFA